MAALDPERRAALRGAKLASLVAERWGPADRRLSERRIYPAIDVDASSTRHEELLFPRGQLNLVWALRRVLSGLSSTDGGNAAALELLIDRMKTFRTNEEFLAQVAKNRLAAG